MSDLDLTGAIEAGAEALARHQLDGNFNCECGQQHPNGSGDNFPTWREALRTHETKVTLHAALPHIRAMIAEEIRDYWEACGDLIDTHNGARLAFDAIAARIAKGAQQ